MNCLGQRQSFSDNENIMIKSSEPIGKAAVTGRSYCNEATGEALLSDKEKLI